WAEVISQIWTRSKPPFRVAANIGRMTRRPKNSFGALRLWLGKIKSQLYRLATLTRPEYWAATPNGPKTGITSFAQQVHHQKAVGRAARSGLGKTRHSPPAKFEPFSIQHLT